MLPFQVTIEPVEDADLGPVLTELAKLGYDQPSVAAVEAPAGAGPKDLSTAVPTFVPSPGSLELPDTWRFISEEEGASYRWPEYREHYDRYLIYGAETEREGRIEIGLGWAGRENVWGRDRQYIIAFLSGGTPNQPLAEFLEADDHATTGEFVAIIRGSDGGRKLYGARDTLPEVYEQSFQTQMYRDRVNFPGVWKKVVVVAHGDDHASILNHGLIQGRRRYGI